MVERTLMVICGLALTAVLALSYVNYTTLTDERDNRAQVISDNYGLELVSSTASSKPLFGSLTPGKLFLKNSEGEVKSCDAPSMRGLREGTPLLNCEDAEIVRSVDEK